MNLRIAIVVMSVVVASTAAQGKKFPLTASTAVPAARGNVEIGKDSNGNTKVKMEAEHLAEPGKLTPPRTDYVVWFQEKGGEAQTQGRLRIDKNLKGSFTDFHSLEELRPVRHGRIRSEHEAARRH